MCERFKLSNILCLSETWLYPDELDLISKAIVGNNVYRPDKFSVFGKSAMHNATVTGRPFGGVAILCKEEPNLSYQEISTQVIDLLQWASTMLQVIWFTL